MKSGKSWEMGYDRLVRAKDSYWGRKVARSVQSDPSLRVSLSSELRGPSPAGIGRALLISESEGEKRGQRILPLPAVSQMPSV